MVAGGTSRSENVPLISAAAEEVLPLVRLPKTDVAVISVDFDGVTKKGLQIARSLDTRYPVVRIAVLLDVGSRQDIQGDALAGNSPECSRIATRNKS